MATTQAATQAARTGWLGRDLTKDRIAADLGPAQLAAIDELMDGIRARGLGYRGIERRDFSHPALDGFLAEILARIKTGDGLVLMRNVPVDRYPLEDIEKIYWGFGTHFGSALSQSTAGDMIGHVTDRASSRGYNSTRKLVMHVDSAETVGLLCVRTAREGGDTVLASSLRMHEILKREHPEHMAILERGFRYHRRGEEAPGDAPISEYRVPVCSTEAGVLSCRYARERIDLAARELNQPLPDAELAALACFEALALREDVRFDLTLQPGEALLTSNFELLHSRTAFLDWDDPSRKRLLLRLWLQGDPERPLKREVFTYQNKSGRQGIDPQGDRQPGLAAFMPHDAEFKLVDG